MNGFPKIRRLSHRSDNFQSENDQAVINELLNDLPSKDRQALLLFYVGGQPHDEIESALGLDPDRFRDLRQFFKVAFFARTGREC